MASSPEEVGEIDEVEDDGIVDEEFKKARKDKGFLAQLLAIFKNTPTGSDITGTVSLPETLESRISALELMQQGTLRHFALLIKASKESDPLRRLLGVLRWHLTLGSTAVTGAKKPLNPVLGEVSRMSNKGNEDNGCTYSLAEQISHHPPISKFVLINEKNGITVDRLSNASGKFLGTSIKLTFAGATRVHFKDHNETYTFTLPNLMIRLLGFWTEFAGDVEITCDAHKYKALVSYKEKPFLRGEMNRVKGKIVEGEGKTLLKFTGRWDKEVEFEDCKTKETFIMNSSTCPRKEMYNPAREEELNERSSLKVWEHVKNAKSGADAAKAKQAVEEEQRRKAKLLKENGEEWKPLYFEQKPNGNGEWILKEGVVV